MFPFQRPFQERKSTEEHVSDIPIPQAVKRLVEVFKLRVVEKTDETVNEEEVHESADDGGPNVFGRGNFADVELFKQVQKTCNPKSNHLSPKSHQDSGETRG